jgi:hypothetical protein
MAMMLLLLLPFWSSGVLEFWSSGDLEIWRSGILLDD